MTEIEPRQTSSELDCLCVGTLVIDHACDAISRLPHPGELVVSRKVTSGIGGLAANAAVALARLGARAGVIGCVGQGDFGRYLHNTLAGQGVDTSGIRLIEGIDTAQTLIVNVAGQDRRFIHAEGANPRLTASDVQLDRVRRVKVLYVGGALLLPGLDGQPLAELFQQARAAGVKTVLDCIVPDEADHWPKLSLVLPHTDVFLPNRDEAERLAGTANPLVAAQRFVDAGAATVVITCGSDGCIAVGDGRQLRVGSYPVECVSATGAGDAFDAGYVFGLLEHCDFAGCLRWASAMGASAVREINATDGLFSRAESEAFQQAHRLEITPI